LDVTSNETDEVYSMYRPVLIASDQLLKGTRS